MINILTGPARIIVFIALIMLLIPCSCQTERETPRVPEEVLPDIRLLPNAAEPVTGGTESAISISYFDAIPDFPQSISFVLEAESNYPITDVQLLYTIPRILRSSVTVTVQPEFEPDTRVSARWTLDTRKSTLPTGAHLSYRWVVENSAQQRVETESVSMQFKDSRHDWKQLSNQDIQLYWYEGDDSFGQALIEAGSRALAKLAEDTNSELTQQVQIYIYGSTEDLHQALVYPDEWTGGMAFPEYGVIVIGVAPYNLEWGKRAVTHELSHMVVYQATYSPLSNVPAWLDEGLAMYAEGDLLSNFSDNLKKAVSEDALYSISSISGNFPAATEEAELAYAQSYSLVTFLIEQFGSAKMQQLLQAFSQGTSLDSALEEVYGFNSDQLETAWLESIL